MNNSLEQENDFLKQCIKIYMECCEERQERIDKAIEYIKTTDKWLCRVNDNLCVETIAKDKLLEILGGK